MEISQFNETSKSSLLKFSNKSSARELTEDTRLSIKRETIFTKDIFFQCYTAFVTLCFPDRHSPFKIESILEEKDFASRGANSLEADSHGERRQKKA